MASPGHHHYTPLEDGAIRVVRYEKHSSPNDLRFSLVHLSNYRAEAAEPYTALSYCWGDVTNTKAITLNGVSFQITTDLWEALSSLWSTQEVSLWIDAICINQFDTEERNIQVGQMWQIFASAELVISWLGPKNEDTDMIFDAAAVVQEQVLAAKSAHSPTVAIRLALELGSNILVRQDSTSLPATLDAMGDLHRSEAWGMPLLKLCCREYFGRTWIIPEVLQARGSIVACGDRSLPWAVFQIIVIEAQYFWNIASKDRLANIIHDSPAVLQAVKICEVRNILHSSADHQDQFEVFYDVLSFYSISKCTDVRDRIFALINDPRIRRLKLLETFKADYTLTPNGTTVLVMAQMTSLILARDGIPGQLYDIALCQIAIALNVNLSSEEYLQWLKPQISRIHETAKTPTGNGVYMIDLKNGLCMYLDTFQLRKLRKDSVFAQYITSPADQWDTIPGCDPIDLADIKDTASVVVTRDPVHGNLAMIIDKAD